MGFYTHAAPDMFAHGLLGLYKVNLHIVVSMESIGSISINKVGQYLDLVKKLEQNSKLLNHNLLDLLVKSLTNLQLTTLKWLIKFKINNNDVS